jgi:transposase InsO family protein
MPWKKLSKVEQRLDLVRQMIKHRAPVVELCGRFKISRQTAYKWLKRYRRGQLGGLEELSRGPLSGAARTSQLWLQRVRRGRLRHRSWGARKLRHILKSRFGTGAPSLATIGRWLKRWGLAAGRPRRRRGPELFRKALRVARRCHEIWTVDFKGWYRTKDGSRVEPLTVRDLYSRYILRIKLLPVPTLTKTRAEFVRIFRSYGLPESIRCDNGTPFGAGGPTGLTRLSAWWVKLGIQVEFITPGRPCENGAHEQFHRVYKAEVARDPARTVATEQRRAQEWLCHYNHQRPHEALGMQTPSQLFKKNRRRMPRGILAWKYPCGWEKRWVRGNGEINWHGVRRYVGEAFVRAYIGLKPLRQGEWNVYFGDLLIGQLHENERGSIRMATYRRSRRKAVEG